MLVVYLTALAVTVAAQVAPGPNLLAVAGAALGQDRRAALCVAAGVASGAFVWAVAFALGMAALFRAQPLLGVALQCAGGGYFLYVAGRALRAARSSDPATIRAALQRLTPAASYRHGLLVVLTNPKAALMWATITAFISGAGASAAGVLLFAPLGSLSALAIYSGYGILFSTPLARRVYRSTARGFQITFGLLFGAFGVKLLFDGLRELRAGPSW